MSELDIDIDYEADTPITPNPKATGASKVFSAMCWGGKAHGQLVTAVSPTLPEATRRKLNLHPWLPHEKVAVRVHGVVYVNTKFNISDSEGHAYDYVPTAWIPEFPEQLNYAIQNDIATGLNFILDFMDLIYNG